VLKRRAIASASATRPRLSRKRTDSGRRATSSNSSRAGTPPSTNMPRQVKAGTM
jgi:hypothetical protein